MKQKIVSLLTAAVMLVPVTVIMPITANAENTPIELGEFVQMGTYDINEDGMAEPIKWRCVAFEKVTGTDENGNPIIDSTQTSMKYREGYLPLMIADNSICEKVFDAGGDNTDSSHGRSESRPSRGSNYWADSNIRDWLNSSDTAGNIVWTCGNQPPYADEAGFLSNFTAEEKAVINTVTQKSILTTYDKDTEGATGSERHTYNNSVSDVVQNYSKAYSEQVTDTMFLLDVQQVKNVYDNVGDYYEPYYHPIYYWLRTPNANHDYLARIASLSGEVNEHLVEVGKAGVRPAFYLNPSAVLYGEGSRYYPYTVVPTHTHYMTAEYNYENAVTFDKELTGADGRLYIDGNAIEPVEESGSSCLELPDGNYYLAENVFIDKSIEIKGNVNLCLNGKTLDMGESGITVSGTFNLSDCGESGTLTSSYHTGFIESGLVTVNENGVFSLYRGKVINTSDKKYSYKQTIAVIEGNIKLYGGEAVSADDNAVYFGSQAENVILSGAPKIKGASDKADIYLRNSGSEKLIAIDAPLTNTEPYRIKALRNDVFTIGWNKHMSERNVNNYFVSTEKGKFINKNDNSELELCDYAITEQVSDSNGYTVTANGTPVSYVWYPAAVTVSEVTDKNAEAYEHNSQISAYDSENGWSGINDVNMNYFKISLSEGDILKVKPASPLDEFSMVSLTNVVTEEFQDVCNANSDGEYVFTAEADGEYFLSIAGVKTMTFPTVTATTIKTVLGSAVEGQTTNKFTGGKGSYLCEVTYEDGTVLRSDVIQTESVEYDYSIKYENGQAVVTVPEDGTYAVVFASYDGGRLVSISARDISLIKGENTVSPDGGFTPLGAVRLMLWNSLEGMKPLDMSK